MHQPLWTPSLKTVDFSNMYGFMQQVRARWGVDISTYPELYRWSITEPEFFWQSVWSFCGVLAQHRGDTVLEIRHGMEQARFFPEARLNYAENLLRRRDESVAIEFFGEDQVHTTLTYAALAQHVAQFAYHLRQWGVQPGDRVVGYMPNRPETIVAMLAAASLGAIWSSCSPDFGVSGVLDRFGQIQPKILITCDGYFYNGKYFDCLPRIAPLQEGLPSLTHTILVGYNGVAPDVKETWAWDILLPLAPDEPLTFVSLPFNHPLFILYSSGTTGVPKCIIHGAGGTLLQHLKEHQLHCDIKPDDGVFYYTTCGWMMWNWLVSALASQARLILYDGGPLHPHPTRLFDIADQTEMMLFGTSAKYIDSLAKLEVAPIKTHKLRTLRMIASTGSPLVPESFDYVYRSIKRDVCLASISGGTDIVSCFMLGNPVGPVWRGELQTAGLGLFVDVFDESGRSVIQEKGELVCTTPFPCQPLGFWGDDDRSRYHQAYFSRFPKVWHHGDFVEKTSHDGFIVYGRSDTVLNPAGVRIGTAEIYRQVEQIEEVLESIVVGQDHDNDVRIVLFVKLRPGLTLDETLITKIKVQIRAQATPRHVPAVILQVSDIPRTKNAKIAEIAVRDTIHGHPIKNQEALSNPEVLKEYQELTAKYLG